jgi:hypothetical protein
VCVAGGCQDGRAKKGLDKGKGEGELKDGFVFLCFLILSLFFGFSFQCRSIDFLSRLSQLLDGFLMQDISSSGPNLVIAFLLSNYSVRVNCGK